METHVNRTKSEEASQQNWYERLGRVIAQECRLAEGSSIEHQCGTVWVPNKEGSLLAIFGVVTEELAD